MIQYVSFGLSYFNFADEIFFLEGENYNTPKFQSYNLEYNLSIGTYDMRINNEIHTLFINCIHGMFFIK